ncbi:MAG: WbqC family protein [Prolixibacteraceae bacterium]|nr:WbqC family protein [Prolixibacteraceae bacterium]
MENAIFSTAYLGPVHYYARFMQYGHVKIEQYDSYQKQSYRNRCAIYGANGLLNLSIPVVKKHKQKTLVRDIEIDYATRWQNNHWRSITSAYNSSPFFEFYAPDFEPFFSRKCQFLIDFNMELHRLIIELLELDNVCELSETFEHKFEGDDYRELITPKVNRVLNHDAGFMPVAYTQTYSEKHGFLGNLSIVDLLFNTGPEAESVLKKSII